MKSYQGLLPNDILKEPEFRVWEDYDCSELIAIPCTNIYQGQRVVSYSDAIITADTETSKTSIVEDGHIINVVVAWTITIRHNHENKVVLWGRKPSDIVECFRRIWANMKGKIIIFIHNLSYDYTFLRQFLFSKLGTPIYQLNTKSHYPIVIDFGSIILRDSLILAQRSIEKWANDLKVEHRKAVGSWDYEKIRSQTSHKYTYDELIYTKNDTLALAECIDITIGALPPCKAPLTATGVARSEMRKAGHSDGKNTFNRCAMTLEQQELCELVYHGGYTHANRYEIGEVNKAVCYDIASSYPNCLIAERYPMEHFTKVDNINIQDILRTSKNYAYMLECKFEGVALKNRGRNIPMPILQRSKCYDIINPESVIIDNGRILACDGVTISITEIDLEIIMEQYNIEHIDFLQCYSARKEYLPRWFTDFVFKLFKDKTQLKGGDPVLYQLAKALLNSCYGMCVQKPIPNNIVEIYYTGEYTTQHKTKEEYEEAYNSYLKKKNNILPYQWGVWCTAYAMRNLFDLGKCVADDGIWLYSDTDSVYATQWNLDKLKQYNEERMKRIRDNGYPDTVINEHDGKSYHLGIAELDGVYSEFKTLGCKRYCCRDAKKGTLKITVAGVPKNGVVQLENDINNFTKGFIFKGKLQKDSEEIGTGKLTHSYYYRNRIDIIDGTEIGDSIDLIPCDYKLDETDYYTIDDVNNTLSECEEIYYG